ncbi:MAG TPA: PilZ domain-containing protein [Solirubrobacteraceae bacterium]|nr:PilZ domain-containing protein [Solirubrobacteraceae bacterium]
MRLARSKRQSAAAPVELPEVSDSVVLAVGSGRIPARVIERGPDMLVVAITVPTRPMSEDQLGSLRVEYVSARGRVRLTGSLASQDPADPEVVRLTAPRSVEVMQEREYVRIRSARPVLVLCSGETGSVQSFTVDVSGGGLLLTGPDTLRVGDELTFRLTLTQGVTPVTGSGRVVRVDGQGRRAVEFISISDLDRRRLVRFIFECQREERRRGLDGDGGRG